MGSITVRGSAVGGAMSSASSAVERDGSHAAGDDVAGAQNSVGTDVSGASIKLGVGVRIEDFDGTGAAPAIAAPKNDVKPLEADFVDPDAADADETGGVDFEEEDIFAFFIFTYKTLIPFGQHSFVQIGTMPVSVFQQVGNFTRWVFADASDSRPVPVAA